MVTKKLTNSLNILETEASGVVTRGVTDKKIVVAFQGARTKVIKLSLALKNPKFNQIKCS